RTASRRPPCSARVCPLPWANSSSSASRGAHTGAPRPEVIRRGPPSGDAGGLAGGRERTRAELGGLDETVLDDRVLDVVLGHGDRLEQQRRDVLGPVVLLVGGRLERLALTRVDRHLRGGLGLGLDRLVHG